MKKLGVQEAEGSLRRCAKALDSLAAATNAADYKESWSDFLLAMNRVYTLLEQGSKTSDASRKWFSEKKAERKDSALLNYLHHARNVHQHVLAVITDETPASVGLGVGPGAWRFDGTLGPGGTMRVTALGGQVTGQSKFVEFTPAKIRMATVIDRGVIYAPPSEFDTPLDAGRSALSMLEATVKEAQALDMTD